LILEAVGVCTNEENSKLTYGDLYQISTVMQEDYKSKQES